VAKTATVRKDGRSVPARLAPLLPLLPQADRSDKPSFTSEAQAADPRQRLPFVRRFVFRGTRALLSIRLSNAIEATGGGAARSVRGILKITRWIRNSFADIAEERTNENFAALAARSSILRGMQPVPDVTAWFFRNEHLDSLAAMRCTIVSHTHPVLNLSVSRIDLRHERGLENFRRWKIQLVGFGKASRGNFCLGGNSKRFQDPPKSDDSFIARFCIDLFIPSYFISSSDIIAGDLCHFSRRFVWTVFDGCIFHLSCSESPQRGHLREIPFDWEIESNRTLARANVDFMFVWSSHERFLKGRFANFHPPLAICSIAISISAMQRVDIRDHELSMRPH